MKEMLLHSGIVKKLGKTRANNIYSKIKKYINIRDRILDVGAGTCQVTEILLENHFQVTPIDVVNESLAEGIKPLIYDGKNLPFKEREFDLSLLINVLHHIKNPESVLKEAARVSKRIIIMEDVYNNIVQKYATFIMDSVSNLEFIGHPHTNKNDQEWKEVFNELDLKVIATREDMFWKYFLSRVYYLGEQKNE